MSGVHIKQDKKNSNNEVSVSTSFEPKAQAPPTSLGGGAANQKTADLTVNHAKLLWEDPRIITWSRKWD